MPATINLDTLPFDIFYQIATSLDDRDYIHLSRVNRAIHDITQSDLLARKTVEVCETPTNLVHRYPVWGPKLTFFFFNRMYCFTAKRVSQP